MRRIVLISCGSKKADYKVRAADLYRGSLFKGCLQYARKSQPDHIYILSAKHGLLELDIMIEPYNVTLNTMSSAQVKAWAGSVIEQLRRMADLHKDHFIFLAGNTYRKHLLPHLSSYEIPLQGLSIGKQLKFLATHNHE